MRFILIQSSLRKDSRTAVVMEQVAHVVREHGIEFDYLDLRDYKLPFCDARPFEEYFDEYPDVKMIREKMDAADGFIFGYPNYVYNFSGTFKNFIDLFGKATKDKYFGMVINAGGRNGYMASNNLISIMLYDFNASAIMPQLYTARGDFELEGNEWKLPAF